GMVNIAKALSSANACKACALGMGGQRGGMTNELDEFPAICNKSVQAQSTDIQPAIPSEVLTHPISDFQQLSAHEMETLGRLNTPLLKQQGEDRFTPVDWDTALNFAAQRFAACEPQRSFFYSSGRSSNEAGFVLQLLARLYGTNNVNNCSYYCHQATAVGLHNSIGTGTATVELADLAESDLIFVIGANPSSNHPRFIHKLKACRDRGGHVIVINPAKEAGLVRFAVPKSAKSLLTGGTWIASEYVQPRIGSDLALFTGIGKALLEMNAIDQTFITQYTNHFDTYRQQLEHSTWDELCEATGLDQASIRTIAKHYAEAKHVVFAWGMGITHHRFGVENVEGIINLALLRGMIGKRYAGLLPLRGHSNVQGIGTIGVKPVLAETVFNNIQRHFNVTLPQQAGLDTLACLTTAHARNIDAALIMGGNLFEASPDSHWTSDALNRIGFKLFLTTTLNRGHVHGVENGDVLILPVTARDEERQATTQESMFNYVRLSDGGITRLDNVRPEVDILCDVAHRLLAQLMPQCPVDFNAFKSHRSIREAIAKIIPGMEDLADIDVAKREFHIRNRLVHSPVFATSDNKASFISHPWQDLINKADPDYPYTLTSVRSEGQFNSIIYEESDSYRGTTQRWVLLMSDQDLSRLGIQAGDCVHVRSPHGEMRALRAHRFDLPAGNVMAYYPEANVLIGRDTDPRSKTPAFKSVPVAICVAD
ncbi:MAG: FdhF/YdeP family oxidoreductase, partial [Gammaproteobacteria bacterium]